MRVLRVIARLNVGGPAIQVINLTRRLQPLGYESVLLRGAEGPREGSMDYLADELRISPVPLRGLRRGLGLHDVRALWGMLRWLRRFRPHILHTHTAKAGAIGRLAVWLAPRWRPAVVVHTFHGHVLKGEFSPRLSRLVALMERFLARRADRVIAVSQEIADDLVEFGVAPREKVEIVRLGFDLSRFTAPEKSREELRGGMRRSLGIPDRSRVVTVIARVVKVKRIDRFIEMARYLRGIDDVWFVVAGDGDRRPELEASGAAQELGGRLVWAGFQRDIPSVCFASDVVVLTSDNEGTPVCLIEAQAASVPVVTTEVGGVRTVVRDGETGLITRLDPEELARGVRSLLTDADRRERMGASGRAHVTENFSVDRLVRDIDGLYADLLDEAGYAAQSVPRSVNGDPYRRRLARKLADRRQQG